MSVNNLLKLVNRQTKDKNKDHPDMDSLYLVYIKLIHIFNILFLKQIVAD